MLNQDGNTHVVKIKHVFSALLEAKPKLLFLVSASRTMPSFLPMTSVWKDPPLTKCIFPYIRVDCRHTLFGSRNFSWDLKENPPSLWKFKLAHLDRCVARSSLHRTDPGSGQPTTEHPVKIYPSCKSVQKIFFSSTLPITFFACRYKKTVNSEMPKYHKSEEKWHFTAVLKPWLCQGKGEAGLRGL